MTEVQVRKCLTATGITTSYGAELSRVRDESIYAQNACTLVSKPTKIEFAGLGYRNSVIARANR